MILHTGVFNVSVLAEDASFDTFKRFGFASGKDTDKFAGFAEHIGRSKNGLTYVTLGTNAFLSAKVIDSYDYGTHTLFIAEVTEAAVLRDAPSVTYGYYFEPVSYTHLFISFPKKISSSCFAANLCLSCHSMPPSK